MRTRPAMAKRTRKKAARRKTGLGVADFRRVALSMPEAEESAHMGHPDFRVRKKIFATLWPDQGWGMVALTPEQQRAFVETNPAMFAPVKGGWGLRGATQVWLEAADEETLRHAVFTAWREKAPKGSRRSSESGAPNLTARSRLRSNSAF